jgi:conjugative relaxase-like TrwC/TraI family protein
MLRVTTLYASSAQATAAYYTRYLAGAPGEEPGLWSGRQATELGLVGRVGPDELEALLEGRDPTGTPRGNVLRDRTLPRAKVVRAVAGFDATFSAPKSVSVWWALTGDPGLLDAHDVAVRAALAHLERFGATTRVRVGGRRLHPDTVGLTMATFRQTTSRADDPQIHTHAVVSSKVQTEDGRWLALDARYLKRHQRMLGGLYQSVLRAELTHRYGVGWEPIVNGQAEIVGLPRELLEVFSKRAAQVGNMLAVKVGEFRRREGRDPTVWERAALAREASADTRVHKTGHGVTDLRTRWAAEAAELDWTPSRLLATLDEARQRRRGQPAPVISVQEVVDRLSTAGSTWTRADVLRAICDVQPAVSAMSGQRRAATLERACDRVIDACVDLDPPGTGTRRASDGRSVWLEPVAPRYTTDVILAEEEAILAWAMDAQADEPAPSPTVVRAGLDVLQADTAAAVAGTDRLVLVVGPAGAGKTTALERAVDDLASWDRPVFGVAPTAKAAHVLGRETGLTTDTVAKLLHEWDRTDRAPLERYRLPAGTTLIVDEAGMIGTASLHHLVDLADRHGWRLALVGDPRQLQAVGRGGLFAELCATGRTDELARLHRFTEPWEAAASLQLRAGDTRALDAYEAHDRIVAGPIDDHLHRLAVAWIAHTAAGQTVAITAATNDHVDAVNAAIQTARRRVGHLDADQAVAIGGGEHAHPGDVVATRRNDRRLHTDTGDTVRNRDLWTVVATHPDGSLTVSHRAGPGIATLPVDYTRQHVRLGYAATEHGIQGDTVDVAIEVVSTATTHRGLYVGVTRGRDDNRIHVITDSTHLAEARDVLDAVLAHDRADIPAVTQRRELARQAQTAGPGRLEPASIIPEWVGLWRAQLESRREELVDYLDDRARRRNEAAAELAELQPALAAARVAWQPYGTAVAAVERELASELRPAMWKANHDARYAGFGHHHTTSRRAKEANQRIADAEAAIAAIHAGAADVKQRLDTFEAEARNLHDLAHPSPSGYGLDELNREDLHDIDGVLHSVDVWTAWAYGRRVASAELVDAVETLTDVARHAPLLALTADQIDCSQWFELLEPVTQLLRQHGIELGHDRAMRRDVTGPELGIEL